MNKFKLLSRGLSQRSVLVTALIVCFLVAVAGCGGGGGSEYNKISGVAAKGLISKGLVKIYKIDEGGVKGELLATTMTDKDGNYSVRVLSGTGFYVEVTGGTYIDEANGVEIERDASDVLRAVVSNHVGGELTIAVTDLTEIAVRIALKMEGGLSSANIETSNTNVSKLLGVDAWGEPIMDITKVNPVDIRDSDAFDGGDENQKRYAKMLAVISQADQNDTEKESGEILDDLAAYLGGHAPAGSVSMETTLAKAAADFFNAANINNVTGETGFNELRDAVAGARYTSPERVTGISVYQSREEKKEELKGSAPGSTGDRALGEAFFTYDTKNNLSNVSIEVSRSESDPDDNMNIIGDLTYEESGALASVKVVEKDAADPFFNFDLSNLYDGEGLLDHTLFDRGEDGFYTVNFEKGNLYHIASCMTKGGGDIGLNTSIDDAGLLQSMTLADEANATIRRLENGRIERILVQDIELPDEKSDTEPPAFRGGNWFYYDGDGNLKTVISLYEINPDGIEGVDELAAKLYEANGKGIDDIKSALKGYKAGRIQYTEYSYRFGNNGGHDIAQIDARLISHDDDTFKVDEDYSVLFTALTEAGNPQRIELYNNLSDDPLMGYATLAYGKGKMKRNIWANAVKEAIRIAYRNVAFVRDVGFFN